jgi:hypothetical protein
VQGNTGQIYSVCRYVAKGSMGGVGCMWMYVDVRMRSEKLGRFTVYADMSLS